MAVIEKEINLAGSKGERKVIAIFDSGATYSCIEPQLAEELGMVESLPEPMEFGTAEDGRKLTATRRLALNFHLNGYRFSDEFMLISGLSEPVLIGAATMQKWRLKLNFETDEVIIDPRVTKLRLLPIIYQIVSKEGVMPMEKSQRACPEPKLRAEGVASSEGTLRGSKGALARGTLT